MATPIEEYQARLLGMAADRLTDRPGDDGYDDDFGFTYEEAMALRLDLRRTLEALAEQLLR